MNIDGPTLPPDPYCSSCDKCDAIRTRGRAMRLNASPIIGLGLFAFFVAGFLLSLAY